MTTPHLRALATCIVVAMLMALSAVSVSAQTSNEFCEQYDSATATTADCATTGQQAAIGQNNFEPTMGVHPDGSLYMATTPARGVAVGWRAGVAKADSLAEGMTGPSAWSDVQPQIAGYSNPPETNDPYAYVDPSTGRIFSFHMSPILLCSIMSFSDDGGETWTTPPVGCGPSGAWDHQTMVAAPPTPGVVTIGYPNVLVQCVNSVYAEMCARSLDGGLTWGAGYPAYPNQMVVGGAPVGAGTQTGHLLAGDDGTIYLPTTEGGSTVRVWVSEDSGLTWDPRTIVDMDVPFIDPALDLDAAGNLHATWIDNDYRLFYAMSQDQGASWSTPVRVTSTEVTATLPALVAGDEGRIAIAFAGTRDLAAKDPWNVPQADRNAVEIGAYLAVATDAVDGTPTFDVVDASNGDPIMRGTSCASRCSYLVDFIDVVMTPDGGVVGAFGDGCTNAACISGQSGNNVSDRGNGLVVTADVDLCEATCHPFEDAAALTSGPLALPGQAGPDLSAHQPYVIGDEIGLDARHDGLLSHLESLGFAAR